MLDKDKLKKILTQEEYHVTQEKGTEKPFENKYWDNKDSGIYDCKVYGTPLFDSSRKYDSSTGWPSFDEALPGVLKFEDDYSLGVHRIEVMCSKCGVHSGHIFEDGVSNFPDGKSSTGKRICTNSASLEFRKRN